MNYIQGNSNISHTYHIFLDSDSGQRAGNSFQFDISPTIEVQYPERGNLYLKEFSGLNTLYNINESNRTNSISVAGGTPISRSLDIGNIKTGDALRVKLDALFGSVANVVFTWNKETLKMTAVHSSNAVMTFSGNLFEKMLNFPVNEQLPTAGIESSHEVDLHRATHNVYMSIAEVANNTRDVGTASNKGNRIAKIPITTEWGAYVVYQALEPVQKSPVENSMLNQLNIQLFDDDGNNYVPDRFTITLALEIAVPVQTDYQNQISDMPGNYSTSKRHPILAPSLHRSCNF